MSRNARKKSESGIYHIMLRGINKQAIFEDDEDRVKLLKVIKQYKNVSKYEIYAYCLMDNHVHLLLKETVESMGLAIKRICGSYVYWYNWKYGRIGHLFQERFKSEVIEDDEYFLTVLRYIHHNPIKAGLIEKVKEYKWSSYNEYIGKAVLADIDFPLEMFSDNRCKAIEQFEKYINMPNEDKCLDNEKQTLLVDSEVRKYMSDYGISNISELQHMEKSQRNDAIKAMKQLDGVSIRQLSRITGISKSVIDRA